MNSLLVIDGDNISTKKFKLWWDTNQIIFKQKVIYGDYSKGEMVSWQKFSLENNFEMFHCPRTNKKQTTDLNLFIDVMIKLYEQDFNEIYISTNDGDFIVLANAWIKKNKTVHFISNNTCSKNINKNFNVINLDNYKTDILESPKKKIKKNNISTEILLFLENNNETTLDKIKLHIDNIHGTTKYKRLIKLIEKIESNYIWIFFNQEIEKSEVFYYPKIEQLKDKINVIKTIKTWKKKLNQIYPNFTNNIHFENIGEIFTTN